MFVHVSLSVYVCVCVPVLVCTLTDCDCVSIGFSPGAKKSWAQTEKWDQRGKLISPSQIHSLLDCVVIIVHTHTHTHMYSEWCPQLLRVLPTLMRCERGTKRRQVESRWITETDRERGRGATINLAAGQSIRKVELERNSVSRNLLEEKRVKVGKRGRSRGDK